MVKRKPVNAGVNRVSNGQPYPVTQVSPQQTVTDALTAPSGAEKSQISSARAPSSGYTSGMANSTSAWADDGIRPRKTGSELPPAFTTAEERYPRDEAQKGEVLPSALRVGPMDDTPRSSFDSQTSTSLPANKGQVLEPNQSMLGSIKRDHNSNNPYLRMRDTNGLPPQGNRIDCGSSVDIWADDEKSSSLCPFEPHEPQYSSQIPSIGPSDLSGGLSERSPFADPWVDLRPSSTQTPLAPDVASQPTSTGQEYLDLVGNPYLTDGLGSHDTGDSNANDHIPNRAVGELRRPLGSCVQTSDGTASSMSQDSGDTTKRLPVVPLNKEGQGPELPLRRSQDKADTSPLGPEMTSPSAQQGSLSSNPANVGGGEPRLSEAEKQQNRAKKQRSETYQIRLVNWYDASCSTNPRRSPIMVQNANGPCPLLALVNALVLSTPAEVSTALVETLRVREQVSLGLLLDAVIDELMSGRRGDAAQDLPDVSDLYAFLITLHTGMNVNPRFIAPEAELPNLMDAPAFESPTMLQKSRKLGGFEDTREMRQYSTFAIPLIHGWLPPRNHAAFAALQRSANTYEDAQNIMFVEEELEDKLQRQGLSSHEQLLLEDVASVKYFLSSSATQLTGYGLDTMTDALLPGAIAILFRNDHFSTLYKHPQSGQLFTLVTDMGYAGHDEVVWESLVDISGEGCEFFAGDFRSVGHNTGKQPLQSNGVGMTDDSGWTTVSRNNNRSRRSLPSGGAKTQDPADSSTPIPTLSSLSLGEANQTPTSPNTEQEDHDLALALQLQEEEEDRERRETAARRREDELSQAYLEAQGPSARRGPVRASEVRPAVPPRGGRPTKQPGTGEDAPPPTYEQAAKVPAYHPPEDDPLALPGRNGNTARTQGTRQRHSSAYSQNTAAFPGSPSTHNANFAGSSPVRGNPRRRSSARSGAAGGFEGVPGSSQRRNGYPGAGAVAGEEDKKDCIVM